MNSYCFLTFAFYMSNNAIYENNENKKIIGRLYGGVFLLLIVILLTVLFTLTRTDIVTNSVLKKENLSFLLLISDDDGPIITEAILYNAETKRLALIDIPYEAGDSLPELKRSDRYSVFYQEGNLARYQSSIEKLLNLNFLFILDLHVNQLVKLVDLLEGISLYLFAPINHINPISKKHYIYNAGEQNLDGDQSRDFLYASKANTIEYNQFLQQSENDENLQPKTEKRKKIILQQKNLRYIRELLLSIITTIKKFDSERENYIRLIYSYFQTDISRRTFRKLLLYMSEIDVESAEIIFQDYLGKERLVQGKQINFPVYDGQVIRSQVVRISTQLHTADKIVENKYPVRVEVLNGTNIVGLASRTAALYSQEGFDVVNIGNADRADYEKSIIINLHSDNLDDVQRVAKLIDVENIILQPLPGGEQAEAEVRIVLGKNFDENRIIQ